MGHRQKMLERRRERLRSKYRGVRLPLSMTIKELVRFGLMFGCSVEIGLEPKT
jgi:hypothetical protein